MKALTLHQPWAQAIVLDLKVFETRSWSTQYKGVLAIHAGKTVDRCRLHDAQIDYPDFEWDVATGAVVAVAMLQECRPTEELRGSIVVEMWDGIDFGEFYWGDWQPGRWAWPLAHIEVLKEPVPCQGMQRLWTLPAAVEHKVWAELHSGSYYRHLALLKTKEEVESDDKATPS